MTNYKRAIRLLKYFHEHPGEEVDSYNEELQNLLEIKQRQLARELENLSQEFDNIKENTINKRKSYKLITPLEVLKESFAHNDTLGMLFDMATEQMPELFEEWNYLSEEYNKPYLFFNMPYEDIKELENNQNFLKLKESIEQKQLVSLEFEDINSQKKFQNIAPIKLLFSEGNWYIVFIKEEQLLIRRVQFIKEINTLNKKFFIETDKYINWFKNYYQNPFTLYGVKSTKAILKAKKDISIYFKPNMKKFFKTQQFIKEENKEVFFSINYTQELEILPFIQKWLPNIEILEPKELKSSLYKKLGDYLKKEL